MLEKVTPASLKRYLVDGLALDGSDRVPTEFEVQALSEFLKLKSIAVSDLAQLVRVNEPKSVLRTQVGMNARFGLHLAPLGGPEIGEKLSALLAKISEQRIDAFRAHIKFGSLRPFSVGNEIAGRALWLWQIGDLCLERGFLHTFYHETLNYFSELEEKL